jgi:hypothetical protein
MAVMVRGERGRDKGRHCGLSWWHGASEGIFKHALSSTFALLTSIPMKRLGKETFYGEMSADTLSRQQQTP